MSKDHAKILSVLKERGIGKSFAYKSFSDYPTEASRQCRSWVESCENDFIAGKALNIVGPSSEAYDLFMLTMRGIILRNVTPARVFSFIGLLTDQEQIDRFLNNRAGVIGISGFLPESSRVDPQQYTAMESIIMRKYMDEMIPIVFHIPAQFTSRPTYHDHAAYGDCLSTVLADRIFKLNKTVEV